MAEKNVCLTPNTGLPARFSLLLADWGHQDFLLCWLTIHWPAEWVVGSRERPKKKLVMNNPLLPLNYKQKSCVDESLISFSNIILYQVCFFMLLFIICCFLWGFFKPGVLGCFLLFVHFLSQTSPSQAFISSWLIPCNISSWSRCNISFSTCCWQVFHPSKTFLTRCLQLQRNLSFQTVFCIFRVLRLSILTGQQKEKKLGQVCSGLFVAVYMVWLMLLTFPQLAGCVLSKHPGKLHMSARPYWSRTKLAGISPFTSHAPGPGALLM